jgi:hypothetical protein
VDRRRVGPDLAERLGITNQHLPGGVARPL